MKIVNRLAIIILFSWEEDKMAAIIVNLECMTNMHVGNGDVNYNIIDNEVEKDPVTGYPTINASGVKGALREFFNGDSELRHYVSTLFGADKFSIIAPSTIRFCTVPFNAPNKPAA